MKNCLLGFVVILASVAAAWSQGAEQPPKAGVDGKTPPKEIAVDLGGGVKMKMVLIPAGEFMMGSGESAEDTAAFFNKNYGEDLLTGRIYFKDEHPQHRVRITKPFYLGTYHVTRGQFRQFVKDTGYKTDAEKGEEPGAVGWNPEKKNVQFNKDYSWRNAGFEQTDEHPVVNVSWNDAVAFCKWLSRKEGKTYRLPTEAEWEYACRAGTTTRYSSGDDPETLAKVATWPTRRPRRSSRTGNARSKPATATCSRPRWAKFKPNAFGLYDMHGNAWQWCADWYGEDYYGKSARRRPNGPRHRSCPCPSGRFLALRGQGIARSAYRYVARAGRPESSRWLPRCQDSVMRWHLAVLPSGVSASAVLAGANTLLRMRNRGVGVPDSPPCRHLAGRLDFGNRLEYPVVGASVALV